MSENSFSGLARLQVTDTEQMTWENDLLNRKEYADRLTTLIKNTKGPYVIGLTSPWGSGKTFFLQAWRHQLLEDKKPCIYFNAWENEYIKYIYEGSLIELSLGKAADFTEEVYNRLQFLKDFHPVPLSQEQ